MFFMVLQCASPWFQLHNQSELFTIDFKMVKKGASCGEFPRHRSKPTLWPKKERREPGNANISAEMARRYVSLWHQGLGTYHYLLRSAARALWATPHELHSTVGHNSCKVAKTPGHYLKPLTCPLNDIGGRRLQSYFQSLPAPMSSQEGCRSWLLDALIPIVHISLLPLGNWNFFQFTALDKHFIPSGKVDLI